MKKQGFTLAEVLITLGIIGIVAEMTIPTLMASFQKNQEVTQLKEVYSQFSQALNMMKADEGISKISDTDILTNYDGNDAAAAARAGDFLKKYFKVIKDCGTSIAGTCFATNYYSIDKTEGPYDVNTWGYYKVITANGESLGIFPATATSAGMICVDLNGPKKPNTAGRDLFVMSFYYDGSVDEVTPECKRGQPNVNAGLCGGIGSDAKTSRQTRFSNNPTQFSVYGTGFGKILNDGWKMDY